MRLPVQVWTPYFWKPPFNETHMRDLRRAQREWRGEDRIFLDPNAKELTRWKRLDHNMLVSECLIPSETINCFVISHIDGLGRVYRYLPLPEDWHGSVSGSYSRWLAEPANICLINSEHTKMPMPIIKDGKVTIVDAIIEIKPGANAPVTDLSDDGILTIGYLGAGHAEMLAPNQEVEAVIGKSHYERQTIDEHEWLLSVSDKDPNLRAISTQMSWNKEPFNYMFGEGAGIDLTMHQGIFSRCIRELEDGLNTKVMKEAETWLALLTSSGRSSIGNSWFSPMALANNEEALFAVESQYDISANTLEELFKLEEFKQVMNRPVDVVVAHDWLGYMWWDFYQDLREKISIRCCQSCGRVIRGGHHDRHFCNRSENPECFRKRNAISQRKKRAAES